jgi:hypothetical protein
VPGGEAVVATRARAAHVARYELLGADHLAKLPVRL